MDLIIKPKNKWWQFNWKEIWLFRDLFYFLAWRDIKVKYKQTILGAGWAIFQPFITMVVFTIFFGKFAKMPSDGAPYPIFVYAGLIFWNLFSTGFSQVSNVFVNNERIITKIYFPRIILPTAVVFTSVVDFFFSAIIMAGMLIYFQYLPSFLGLLLIPLLIILTFISTLGAGLLAASLNVRYRDMRYILPFFIQILLFVTPVIYPVSIVSQQWRWVLGLNPMSGIIDTARAGLLGTTEIDWLLLGVSAISMTVYCLIGYFYFKKTERYFADVI